MNIYEKLEDVCLRDTDVADDWTCCTLSLSTLFFWQYVYFLWYDFNFSPWSYIDRYRVVPVLAIIVLSWQILTRLDSMSCYQLVWQVLYVLPSHRILCVHHYLTCIQSRHWEIKPSAFLSIKPIVHSGSLTSQWQHYMAFRRKEQNQYHDMRCFPGILWTS